MTLTIQNEELDLDESQTGWNTYSPNNWTPNVKPFNSLMQYNILQTMKFAGLMILSAVIIDLGMSMSKLISKYGRPLEDIQKNSSHLF